jgi:hypothetical protein
MHELDAEQLARDLCDEPEAIGYAMWNRSFSAMAFTSRTTAVASKGCREKRSRSSLRRWWRWNADSAVSPLR